MNQGSTPTIQLTISDAAIEFSKPKDRFEHRLLVQCANQRICVLSAHLQDPLAPWPSDPAIQQLVVEPIGPPPHRDVALGVGMSGHGHWSLAAQWMEPKASGPAIQLDYACKQQPPVDFLGSTYQIPQNLRDLGIALDRVDVTDQRWSGWFSTDDLQARYQLSIEVIAGRLDWQPDIKQICVRPEGSFEKPSTLRWCYRIAWLSCHE